MNKISKKALVLRIAACVLGVVIIGGCIAVTMSYTGNPVSEMIAKRNAEKNIYNDIFLDGYDFYVKDVKYSKGEYTVIFQDKNIMDANFSAYCNSVGEYTGNDFIQSVDQRGATYRRLSEELKKDAMTVIKPIAESKGLKLGEYSCAYPDMYYYDGEFQEGSTMLPPWDTPYSRELGIEANYSIDFSSKKDLSVQEMADIIMQVYNNLIQNGFLIDDSIWASFEFSDKRIMIYTEKDSIDEKLAEKIEHSMKYADGTVIDGVSITIENGV